MKRMSWTPALLAASALLMGARGCSDCQQLQAAAALECAQRPEGQACRDAQAAADAACKPAPVPTPTPPPPPPPQCPATCPPVQVCLDPIVGCEPTQPPPEPTCVIPPDQGWEPIQPDPGPTKLLLIQRAQDQVGDRCGKPAHASGLMVVAKLNGWGECSTLWDEDVLMIRVSAERYEQWDIVRGDGCYIQRYGYSWRPPGSAPPPEPEPAACPAPVPARTWPDGTPHWWIACKVHGAVIDCTHMYRDAWDEASATCPYCTAIGMGTIGGQSRCSCPTRPDGHPDRVACEEHVAGGELVLQSRGGAQCVRVAATMFEPQAGGCRLCSPDGSVCGEWY